MKNLYVTLDTETFGGAAAPKGIYHLGGQIHDRMGNVFASFNYLIAEYFSEINKDEYAKKNFERYLRMVANGEATMIATEAEAVAAVDTLLNFFNVRYVMAFNTGFDYCKTACRDLLEGREFIDIQLMAMQILGKRKSYIDFCLENNLRSRSGKCIASTAESFFAFISQNPSYKEEHTALEDAKIELQIFVRCVKAHKPYTKNCHQYDYEGKWGLYTRI